MLVGRSLQGQHVLLVLASWTVKCCFPRLYLLALWTLGSLHLVTTEVQRLEWGFPKTPAHRHAQGGHVDVRGCDARKSG